MTVTKKPFPPKPADIDWSAVSLTSQPTINGHVECRYLASEKCWTAPKLVRDPYIKVHGLAPGLNYGQQVYEGLKAFRTPDNKSIRVFRPDAHAQRMRHSARMVCLPEIPDKLFHECVFQAVASNAEFVPPAASQGFMYIRPVLFGAGPQLALMPPNEFVFAVYVVPAAPYHGDVALDACVLDEFDRAAPRGTGGGKIGGNYSPVWPHQAKAKEMGFHVTLHLDSETRTYIEEFSTSGFIGIDADSRAIWVPDTPNAIPSITINSLTMLAESQGWAIIRNKIPFSSIHRFSEVFAVGTAANAVPIRSITRHSTKEKFEFDGSSGKVGHDIVQRLKNIQLGLEVDEFAWCLEVDAKPVSQFAKYD